MVGNHNNADKTSVKDDMADNERKREMMRSIVLKWIADNDAKGKSAPPMVEAPPATASEKKEDAIVAAPGEVLPSEDLTEAQKAEVREALKVPERSASREEARQAVYGGISADLDAEAVEQENEPSAEVIREPLLNFDYEVKPSFALKRSKMSVWGWLFSLLWTVFMAIMIILSVGVYRFGWNDRATNALLSYIPLPYGFVRYHPIWYGTYRQEYQAISLFRSQQAGLINTEVDPAEIEQILVRRAMASDLALRYGIWVTNQEINSEFDAIAANAGSIELVEKWVQLYWGYNINEYKQLVIKSFLVKKKLAAVLAERDPIFAGKLTAGASVSQNLRLLDDYLDKQKAFTSIVLFR